MCANLLGLDYDSVALDVRKGEHKTPEYLAINPFGKIPAIDDDGFYLFESNAIMKYLCRKHRSAFYPKELHAQATVDQWCDFAAGLLLPAYGRVVFNRLFAALLGATVNEDSLNDGLKFIANYLPVLDQRLESSKYVAGPALTVADLAILATLDPSEACQIELSPFASLYKWREELRAKRFYRDVHAYFGQGILASARA